MQQHVKQFLELVIDTVPLHGPIYEFGSLQVQGDSSASDLRPLFNKEQFFGCDYRSGPGVDLVLDLHDIALGNECAGTVVSLDTLEHVEYPRKALKEIHRILDDDGVVIISSVMNFPIHDYPNDYWRFTPNGFISLLSEFQSSFVGSCGADASFPQTIVGIGFKGNHPDLKPFQKAFKQWENSKNSMMKELQKRGDEYILAKLQENKNQS